MSSVMKEDVASVPSRMSFLNWVLTLEILTLFRS